MVSGMATRICVQRSVRDLICAVICVDVDVDDDDDVVFVFVL
jgi:hypothetical protein